MVSLSDNLSPAIAHEKCRARDPALRSNVRHACAICIAADIEWKQRYVVSEVNPDDKPSRAADRGELRPGQRECMRHRDFELVVERSTTTGVHSINRPRRVSMVARGLAVRPNRSWCGKVESRFIASSIGLLSSILAAQVPVAPTPVIVERPASLPARRSRPPASRHASAVQYSIPVPKASPQASSSDCPGGSRRIRIDASTAARSSRLSLHDCDPNRSRKTNK